MQPADGGFRNLSLGSKDMSRDASTDRDPNVVEILSMQGFSEEQIQAALTLLKEAGGAENASEILDSLENAREAA
ncbi:MAG: hypothetical protein N2C14_25545 [Planctomycetales bacterium]